MMNWKTAGWGMFGWSVLNFWVNGTDMQVFGPFALGLFCFAVHSILMAVAKH